MTPVIAPLQSIIVEPEQTPVGSVIWLHGLGADGHDFANIVPLLNIPENLPLRFIFPHAPIQSVTINSGMKMRAWFDVYSLQNLEKEDLDGLQRSQRQIEALIARETELGIPNNKIVLGGFSQGGALSLYAGLRQEKSLAGILALSCYLPMMKDSTLQRPSLNRVPTIFLAHGEYDYVVPYPLGVHTHELLEKLGYSVQWNSYPMGHEVLPQEINDIGRWLETALGTG